MITILAAACFRRLRSLPFLCTSFYPNSCHRPGPCNRSDLCTRALVVAFERQPSCVGRRRLGPRWSRRRHARLKTQLEGRQPRRQQLLLWMVSCINLIFVWLISGRLRACVVQGKTTKQVHLRFVCASAELLPRSRMFISSPDRVSRMSENSGSFLPLITARTNQQRSSAEADEHCWLLHVVCSSLHWLLRN